MAPEQDGYTALRMLLLRAAGLEGSEVRRRISPGSAEGCKAAPKIGIQSAIVRESVNRVRQGSVPARP